MNPILTSALSGAAGAAAGAGIAWLVGRLLRRRPGWLPILPVLGIGIALAIARSLQPSFGDRLMVEMDDLPSVQALKAHYPADYEALRSSVRGLPADARADDVRARTAEVFARVLRRQIPKADAESIYALQQVTRSYSAALRDVDARGCVAMMEGDSAPPTIAEVRRPDIERADMSATARVLIQTATKPAPPPTPMPFEDLLRLSAAALATLPERDQDVTIAILREERDPRTPEENRIMCDFNLALTDQLLALPPREGGAKIRAMMAMN